LKTLMCLGILGILALAHMALRHADRNVPRFYIETLRQTRDWQDVYAELGDGRIGAERFQAPNLKERREAAGGVK
jgi:hypothetical protein